MNREIKFRLWDNVDYMSTPFTLQDIQDKKIQFTSDCKIMQFAGLLDKNGKEIYEGDIICIDEYNAWDWRGVVKFSHGVFGAEWLANIESQSMVGSWGQKHNLRKLDDDILDRHVIIGNIYENPELLVP